MLPHFENGRCDMDHRGLTDAARPEKRTRPHDDTTLRERSKRSALIGRLPAIGAQQSPFRGPLSRYDAADIACGGAAIAFAMVCDI